MARGIVMTTTTPEHMRYIAEHFRPEEGLECMAAWGEKPITALSRSWVESREVHTFLGPNGKPLCVAGVAYKQINGDWWNPWLLGTTDILNHRIKFLRACQEYLPVWQNRYKKMLTWIDARYTASLEWAAWLGCEISPPAPFGVSNALFCEVRLTWEAPS